MEGERRNMQGDSTNKRGKANVNWLHFMDVIWILMQCKLFDDIKTFL